MLLKFVVSKRAYDTNIGERFLINTNNLKLVNQIYNALKCYAVKNDMILGVEKCIPMTSDIPLNTVILPLVSEMTWAIRDEDRPDALSIKSEIHKILKNLGLDITKTDKVYDRTFYSVIKLDYDSKNCNSQIMNDIQYLINTFGTDIQRITIHETFKGYHVRAFLSKFIPFGEKIKFYSESNQDQRRKLALNSIYTTIDYVINEKYLESVLQFYEVLFYKKTAGKMYDYTERLVMKL